MREKVIDSVITDYIITEKNSKNLEILSHEYLHDAMENNLGIHEHWDLESTYKKINYIQLYS